MALARVELIKSPLFLNIEDKGRFHDELCECIETASDLVNIYCGRNLEIVDYSEELLTPVDPHFLWPDNYPVNSITTLELWDSSGKTYETEDSGNYQLVKNRYIYYPALGKETDALYSVLKMSQEFFVRLSYNAGYDTTGWDTMNIGVGDAFGVPRSLEYATAGVGQLLWMDGRVDQARFAISGITTDRGSIQIQEFFETAFTKKIKLALDNYVALDSIV